MRCCSCSTRDWLLSHAAAAGVCAVGPRLPAEDAPGITEPAQVTAPIVADAVARAATHGVIRRRKVRRQRSLRNAAALRSAVAATPTSVPTGRAASTGGCVDRGSRCRRCHRPLAHGGRLCCEALCLSGQPFCLSRDHLLLRQRMLADNTLARGRSPRRSRQGHGPAGRHPHCGGGRYDPATSRHHARDLLLLLRHELSPNLMTEP